MAKKYKNKYKDKILLFIADTENEFPTRGQLPEIVGIKRQSLYDNFTPAELAQIEKEGLDLRRKRCASKSAKVDKGLMERAESGDPSACKLYYQRIEGWSEKLSTGIPSGDDIDSITISYRKPIDGQDA